MRILSFSGTFMLVAALAARGELDLQAPHPGFAPVNQLTVSGNGCGPAALLNAFGCGNTKWREIEGTIPGKSHKSKLTYVIRGYGLKPSKHLDRLRWTRDRGVNLADLTDMANEMRGGRWLPTIKREVFVAKRGESGPKLVRRIHGRLTRSLKKGLPPVLSLQRMARPTRGANDALSWRLVHGHFIVITALPSKLERNATWFPFRYIDPWGGKVHEGTIQFDPAAHYPAATANVPQTAVGKRYVRSGEHSLITVAGAMGVF